MKAHRFRADMPTRAEIAARFDRELRPRVDARVRPDTPPDMARQIWAEEKLRLLKEWERAGRNTAFNTDPMQFLLDIKYYGKS